MTVLRRVAVAGVAVTMLTGCTADPGPRPPGSPDGDQNGGAEETEPEREGDARGDPPGRRPLAGTVVVLDPGHQLGNTTFPEQTLAAVPAGGFTKPCNTTGTATDDGYAEATFNFGVASRVRERLVRLGARVLMTRESNRPDRWGPCVDERGRRGNRIGADLKVSIHGDGSLTGGRGFHIITPIDRAPWTDDIYASSRRLALDLSDALLAGDFEAADYVASGTGLDYRSDLATLNLSDIPTVAAELGNMRNRREAAVMTSARGQARYAAGLVRGIRAFLDR